MSVKILYKYSMNGSLVDTNLKNIRLKRDYQQIIMFRIFVCHILLLVLVVDAGVNVGSNKKSINLDVKQRNLVNRRIGSPYEIFNYHSAYCTSCAKTKNFAGDLLGFISPWTAQGYGYETSRTFANKFDILSPVVLEMSRVDYNFYEVLGPQFMNFEWMNEMKNNSRVLIPRLGFDKLASNEDLLMLENLKEQDGVIKYLLDVCDQYHFEGFLFHFYDKFSVYGKNLTNRFITNIAEKFHANNKKVYLLIYPPIPGNYSNRSGAFNKDDFDQLKDLVDGFTLMTFDYSHYIQAAPNAPIDWVQENVLHFLQNETKTYGKKILIGLNFYGVRYNLNYPMNEAILGSSFVEMLIQNWDDTEIIFDNSSCEHSFLTKEHRIYFPTLYSINKRLELATKLGTGVFIWDLGQGLDYFYDLF